MVLPTLKVNFQCISNMKEYKAKSPEELRFEDYMDFPVKKQLKRSGDDLDLEVLKILPKRVKKSFGDTVHFDKHLKLV